MGLYKPTTDYDNATSTLPAYTTEHATTNRHLIVKSSVGIKSIDNQAFGGDMELTDYVNRTVGNLGQVVDAQGKLYGVLSAVLDEGWSTVLHFSTITIFQPC